MSVTFLVKLQTRAMRVGAEMLPEKAFARASLKECLSSCLMTASK